MYVYIYIVVTIIEVNKNCIHNLFDSRFHHERSSKQRASQPTTKQTVALLSKYLFLNALNNLLFTTCKLS
jgi:hypothetical protein